MRFSLLTDEEVAATQKRKILLKRKPQKFHRKGRSILKEELSLKKPTIVRSPPFLHSRCYQGGFSASRFYLYFLFFCMLFSHLQPRKYSVHWTTRIITYGVRYRMDWKASYLPFVQLDLGSCKHEKIFTPWWILSCIDNIGKVHIIWATWVQVSQNLHSTLTKLHASLSLKMTLRWTSLQASLLVGLTK